MYISTTFYLDIKTAFLNGIGSEDTQNGTITKVKQFQQEGESYPYVSAQALRKWIRRTVNHLTGDFSYYERITRSSPNKSEMKEPEGLWIDPVEYIEDDLFGYSHPFYNQPDQENTKHLKVTTANRLSPFQTTALVSLPETAEISEHDGWVKPEQNSSLPFNTEMMSGFFEGSATLDLARVGVFRIYGDTFEIDPFYLNYYLEKGKLIENTSKEHQEYQLMNLESRKQQALHLYYDSLLNLYGAAKSTILASDLSPRVLITAKLNSANNLFQGVLTSDEKGGIMVNYDLLEKRVENREQTLVSDVYFGYRSGTFTSDKENELRSHHDEYIGNTTIKLHIVSPGEATMGIMDEVEVLQ